MLLNKGFLSKEFPDYDGYISDNHDQIISLMTQILSIVPPSPKSNDWKEDDELLDCSIVLATVILDDSIMSLDDITFPLAVEITDQDQIAEFAQLLYITYVYDGLIRKGLVSRNGDLYSLTDEGKKLSKQLIKERSFPDGFD
jgi:hypothetical protein